MAHLDNVRIAVESLGWFPVIDYLFHLAEDQHKRSLAEDLDRAGTTLRLDIEALGGKPEYVR